MAFHYKDNWHFERLEDGSVKISNPTHHTVKGIVTLTIDPDSWGSIVASVTKSGDNANTFKLARILHNS